MSQIVAAITVCTDALGTTATHYFTDGAGFCSTPTDAVPDVWVQPRLIDAGSYRRELFSGSALWGAVRPSFGELRLANADEALDSWLNYGVDGQPVTLYWGDPDTDFPDGWTVLFKAYGHSIIADFGEVRLRLRDRLQLMDVLVCTETFAGTGGVEGPTGMTGQPKPRAFGIFRDSGIAGEAQTLLPVTLLDASIRLYYQALKSPASLTAVYEGGAPITYGGAYTSESDLLTGGSPSAGEYKVYYPAGEPCYFRTGSVPIYELRANYRGVAVYPAREVGLTASDEAPAVTAYVDDGAVTWLELAESACMVPPRFFGMTRLDVYQTAAIAAPGVTPVHTFTQHNASDFVRVPPAGAFAPLVAVTLNAGRTWPCVCAGSVDEDVRAMLEKPDYVSKQVERDDAVLTKHPSAPTLRLTSDHTYDASDLADYLTLFGVERDSYQLTAPLTTDTLDIELHDTVALALPRFGLSAGKNFRVVAVEYRLRERSMHFVLWG